MNHHLSSRQDDKVADAIRHTWVYFLPRYLWPYAQLARWDRPIGWQLLMWPCWWSLMLSAIAQPRTGEVFWTNLLALLALFLVGAFVMRGAGCTYNDIVDVDIDESVERTRSRPLPSGRATKNSAFLFLMFQAFTGLAILIAISTGSWFTFLLGVTSLVTVVIYPFMKRITWWPQLFLGLAFSWGALMGWTSLQGTLSLAPVLLYVSCIFWVIGYDTIYAHQDRKDDALIGVKSTARLFGKNSKRAISVLYGLALLGFGIVFWLVLPPTEPAALPAWAGLAASAFQMIWQIIRLDIENPEQCLRLFKANGLFGLVLFVGLLGSWMLL